MLVGEVPEEATRAPASGVPSKARTVPVTVTKDDLDRRVTAFGAPDSGDELCITLHGHRFRYVAPEAEAPQEEPELLAIEKFARRA